MSELKNKFFYQLLFALSQLVFPLITYPYITRLLGPSNLGKVAYVEYVAGLVVALAAVGIPIYATRKVAEFRNDPSLLKKLTKEIVLIHSVSTVVGIIPYLIFFQLNNWLVNEPILVWLGCLNIIFSALTVDWFFQGIEAFRYIAIRNILLRLLGVAAVFILLNKNTDYIEYYFISVAVQFFITIVNYFQAKKYWINIASASGLNAASHFKPLFYFFITSTLTSIFVFFDTIMLGWMTDDTAVGYYSTAIKIVKLSLLFILTVNAVLFPRISFLTSGGSEQIPIIKNLLRQSVNFIFFLSMPALIYFLFIPAATIGVIAGNSFIPAFSAIQWLSLLPFLWGMNNTILFQVLIPFKKEKQVAGMIFFASVLNITANYFLIIKYQYTGPAIAALITEVFILITALIIARRTIAIPIDLKSISQIILASAFIIPVIVLVQQLSTSYFIIFIGALLFGALVYFMLLHFLFRNESLLSLLKFVKSAFNR